MAEISDVFFVDGMRTPFGRAGEKGMYWNTRADDLVVKATIGLLERNPGVPKDRVDDVAIAATSQTGDQGLTLGRSVAILAGLPKTVPGFAIDRMCAGAMTSVTTMVASIGVGMYDVALAGGVEHMGHHPIGGNTDPNPRLRRGAHGRPGRRQHGRHRRTDLRPVPAPDEGALRPVRHAEPAQGAGGLRRRQVPARPHLCRRQGRRGLVGLVTEDEGRRPQTTLEDLAGAQDALPPARPRDGRHIVAAHGRLHHRRSSPGAAPSTNSTSLRR